MGAEKSQIGFSFTKQRSLPCHIVSFKIYSQFLIQQVPFNHLLWANDSKLFTLSTQLHSPSRNRDQRWPKCTKTRQRQNLSMRFDDLSRHLKKIWPSVRLLSSFICLKKLLGTGVEFHSQFIQVCLSAIKTRQHALIFYTRKGSQKAITHKFLIMFCLLPSVTTRTSRRRNPLAAKKSSNTTVQIKDKCMEHVADFFMVTRKGTF